MNNKALRKKDSKIPFILLTLFALAALLARSLFSIDTTDEVFNIGQAYRTVIGQKFMVENWDYFQVGDSLNYPFIYLFYKLTGSTEGIVLYSRICFILISLVFGFITYKLLKPIFGRNPSFAAAIIYYTMVTKTLFNYWYDTWSLLFMLLSFLLLLCAKRNGDSMRYFVLSGVCQAVSVYCYPTAVVVFIVEFILLFVFSDRSKKKISLKKPEMLFAIGAALVFLAFVIFSLTRDWSSFFIFDKDIALSGLSDRIMTQKSSIPTANAEVTSNPPVNTGSSNGFIGKVIKFMLNTVSQFRTLIAATIVFALICIAIKKFKLSKIHIVIYTVVTSVVLWCISLYNIAYISGATKQVQLYILLYWSMCSFFFHLIFYRKDKRFNDCFIYLFIPAVVAGMVWAVSGKNGSVNFALGARPAAVMFILELFDTIEQIKFKQKNQLAIPIICIFLVFNTVILFNNSFHSSKPSDILQYEAGYSRTESGIFKGIYDKSDKSASLTAFEETLNSVKEDNDKTILCGRKIIFGYLMTDLKPNTNYLWRPGILGGDELAEDYYDILFKYFDLNYGTPDIIVLRKDEKELENEVFSEFLNGNYEIKAQNSTYIFYHSK